MSTIPFLALLLLGILFATSHGSNFDRERRCPDAQKIVLSDLYLNLQPGSPASWSVPLPELGGDSFIDRIDDDAVQRANVANVPAAVGKAAVVALIQGINTQYQRIYKIVEGPYNTVNDTSVTASFIKTQGSLLMGIPYDLPFYHTLNFVRRRGKCYITDFNEFANLEATQSALALETGKDWALTCNRISHVCKGVNINYGTTENNCYLLWKNAPRIQLNDLAFNSDATLVTPGRNLLCANFILSTIENLSAIGQIDEPSRQFLCSFMGAPIPGVPGCWPQ